MKFMITGADRQNGEERQVILDARNHDAACAEANRLGLLVAECMMHNAAAKHSEPHKITGTCPDCGAAAQLSRDNRRGRCGRCGKVFVAPTDSPSVTASADTTQSMKTCPFCAETINAKAIKCRWCGEMLNGAAPVPLAQPKLAAPPPLPAIMPSSMAAGCVTLLVVLGLVIAVALWLFSGSNEQAAVSLPISSTSFVDFDSKFCVHSQLTDVQKDQQIAGFKGQRVRWEGIVSYVSDDSVGFKHKATTATYDVLLRVLSNERARLTNLNNGELVTYEGTIEDYGTILPHGLKDGHIVGSRPMSSGDQLVFLAKTETAVMERIGGNADP